MHHPEADTSLAESVLVSSSILIGLTTFAISVRVWARFYVVRVISLDDALIILSWLFTMAVCVLVLEGSRHGLGHHREYVSDENYTLYLKIQIATSCCYSIGVAAAKASFAILYLRIFPENRLAILNKGIILFVLCQAIEEACIVIFKCKPVSKSWHPDLEGTCITLVPLWWTTFVFNLATDLILFVQPIPSVWRLQMPIAKRVGIIAMFSLGLLVTAISIIRITYVTKIGDDDTFDLAEPLLWSAVEICALVICSCIPSLRQLAARVPGLNSLLGLSSVRESRDTFSNIGGWGLSIQLRRRRDHREYALQQSGGTAASKQRDRTLSSTIKAATPYGASSRVEVEALDSLSEHGSTDRIFPPQRREGEGDRRSSSGDADSNRTRPSDGNRGENESIGRGIIVTHEFRHEIVTNVAPSGADAERDASPQNHNGIEQVPASSNVTNIEATSPRLRPRSDSGWPSR